MKKIGIIFLITGAVSLFIQNTFYGYVDADGVLHDSLFLPLGVIAIILSMVVLIAWGGMRLFKH